jgi:D-inositol-3-phosphate glycosyltransferase
MIPMSVTGSVKRLCVICYHSSPMDEPGSGDAGGMTVYVRAVAQAMAQLGVTTDIFTRSTFPEDRPHRIFEGVRVIPIEAGPPQVVGKEEGARYLDDFVSRVRAFSLAQRISYDLVHSHYWQSGLAAKELARAWGVPMVHSHHSLGRVKNGSLAPGDRPEPALRLVGEEEVIGSADVLLASTDEEWAQLACLYGAEHDRVKTIHPGVDHTVFHPGNRDEARRALGLEDEAVMLYVGRIQPLKGLDLVIDAVADLVSRIDRSLTFLVAGGSSGPAGHAELERLAKLAADRGVQDVVRFIGPQPHRILPLYYRAADVAVVCSHSESFGLSALEAHACGTPVVATAVGGLSYVVDEGRSGSLVDSRDPRVFSERLLDVLKDATDRGEMREHALHSAARFSWDTTARELVELYECLCVQDLPEACTC